MKITKLISCLLALVCAASIMVACDIEGLGNKEPETPAEYYTYACDYMLSHPYKQTTVTTVTMDNYDMDETSSTSVTYMDGNNYYQSESGMTTTFYDGTMYVDYLGRKRKAEIDLEELGESFGLSEDYFGMAKDSITDESIKLTENADGTKTLEFEITLPVVGATKYVMTLDASNRVVCYTLTMSMSVMGYTYVTVEECTIEYGEQYKVTPPEDADEYELVDSYMDLVM